MTYKTINELFTMSLNGLNCCGKHIRIIMSKPERNRLYGDSRRWIWLLHTDKWVPRYQQHHLCFSHDVKCGFHIRSFHICISRYSRFTICQWEKILIFFNSFAWTFNTLKYHKWPKPNVWITTILLYYWYLYILGAYPIKMKFSSKYKKHTQ